MCSRTLSSILASTPSVPVAAYSVTANISSFGQMSLGGKVFLVEETLELGANLMSPHHLF